jgi:hypothetical protein
MRTNKIPGFSMRLVCHRRQRVVLRAAKIMKSGVITVAMYAYPEPRDESGSVVPSELRRVNGQSDKDPIRNCVPLPLLLWPGLFRPWIRTGAR